MADIQAMMNKEVEVSANGVTYTGILIEVSEKEVYLKNAMQWITLPTSAIGEIRLKKTEDSLPTKPEGANQEN